MTLTPRVARIIFASGAFLGTSFTAYKFYHPSSSPRANQISIVQSLTNSQSAPSKPSMADPQSPSLPAIPPSGSFTLTLSTPLHCESCISSVTTVLQTLPGIHSVSCSLESQLVTVKGSAPPSAVIKKVQETGRAAVLRGSGNLRDGGAGVCILEIPVGMQRKTMRRRKGSVPRDGRREVEESPVRGLIRFIQLEKAGEEQKSGFSEVRNTEAVRTLLDLTLTGRPKGQYTVRLHTTGDISSPPASLGPPAMSSSSLSGAEGGFLGAVSIDATGRGELISEIDMPVWQMVGRGISVQRTSENILNQGLDSDGDNGHDNDDDEGLVVGVVARSAGVWENEKVVCGCSGKTVWEEREEMIAKGIN